MIAVIRGLDGDGEGNGVGVVSTFSTSMASNSNPDMVETSWIEDVKDSSIWMVLM